MKPCSLFLIFSIIVCSINAQNWSSVIVVNDDISKGFTRPRIDITNGNVPVVTWGKSNNIDLYTARKVNAVFSSPMKLNPNGLSVFTQNWAGPEMASFAKEIIVTFKSIPENKSPVYMVRSIDAGSSFSDTIRVSNNKWSRFPTPSVSPSGNIHIAYMEFDSGFVDPHYVVTTSTNGGVSFAPPVTAAALAPGESCDCCPAHLMSESNDVTLLFRNNDNNVRDIWAAVSSNSGTWFTKAEDIDLNNWVINSCPSSGPDAIFFQDSIIFTWFSGANGPNSVYFGTAHRNSLIIGKNEIIDLHPFSNQNYPRIAGNEDTLGIVWQESGAGKSVIKGKFTTNGVNELTNVQVDTISESIDDFQQSPDVAFANGKFHIVWQNNTSKELLYRSVDFEGPLGISNSLTEDTKISLFPNPSEGWINVIIPKTYSSGLIQVYNVSGNLILEEYINERSRINFEFQLGPGLYLLKMIHETSFLTSKFSIK